MYFCFISISCDYQFINTKVLSPSRPLSSEKLLCRWNEKFLPRRDRRSAPGYYSTDSHAHAINKYKYYCFMQKPFECFWVLLWQRDCWRCAQCGCNFWRLCTRRGQCPKRWPFSHLNKHFCTTYCISPAALWITVSLWREIVEILADGADVREIHIYAQETR